MKKDLRRYMKAKQGSRISHRVHRAHGVKSAVILKNLRASAFNFCLIFLIAISAFAQENPQSANPELLEIQSEIDSAALMRSPEEISEILKNHKNDENYPEIENLVLEKVQNLVTNEDFELARGFSMAVIENNISNFEAIDLYSYIEKILANERAYQRNRELHRYSRD